MSFDPLNPFASGPFILPVNLPGESSGLQVLGQYQTSKVFEGTVPLVQFQPQDLRFPNRYGVVELKVALTADPNATLNTLISQGLVSLVMIEKNPATGDDVRTLITNPGDITTILAWLNAQQTQTDPPGGPATLSQFIARIPDPKDTPSHFPNISLPGPLLPIMTPEIRDEANDHTLQRLIEVNYIREANRVLSSALVSLNDALTGSKGVLDTLATLQNLHNRVTVITPKPLAFSYLSTYGGVSHYSSAYQKAASAYFGPPIVARFLWSSANAIVTGQPGGITVPGAQFAHYATELQTSRNQLSALLSDLLPRTPRLISGDLDPNSLYVTAKKVLDAMPRTNSFSAVRLWANDNYDEPEANISGSGKAGQLQQDITTAITAGQSLNDTLKEKVRRYMFVFEEYYKSASAMLTKISDLINKFAQGIRPS